MKFSSKKISSIMFLLLALIISLISGAFYNPYMEGFETDPSKMIDKIKQDTTTQKKSEDKPQKQQSAQKP